MLNDLSVLCVYIISIYRKQNENSTTITATTTAHTPVTSTTASLAFAKAVCKGMHAIKIERFINLATRTSFLPPPSTKPYDTTNEPLRKVGSQKIRYEHETEKKIANWPNIPLTNTHKHINLIECTNA